MAGSGVQAEIKKLAEKVAKEVLRNHSMIKHAAVWHKQMQDTQRSILQKFDSFEMRLKRLEHDCAEIFERIEALESGKRTVAAKKEIPIVNEAQAMNGTQLKHLRMKRPLTQQQLASLLGVSVARLGNWEKGRRPIPADVVAQIKEIMSFRASELRSIAIRNGHYLKNQLVSKSKKEVSAKHAFLRSMLTGEDLKKIRQNLNFTQKKIASLIGVPDKTYQGWEAERVHMPDKYTARVQEIARMHGTDTSIPAQEPSNLASPFIVKPQNTPSPITGAELKALRLSLNLAQRQIAPMIGISMDTYKLWEQGKKSMPDRYIAKVRELHQTVPQTDSRVLASRSKNTPSPITGAELKALRLSLNLVQREIAPMIGAPMDTYKLWEQDKKSMPDRYTAKVRELQQTVKEVPSSPVPTQTRPASYRSGNSFTVKPLSPITKVELKAIREKMNLSQAKFAKVMKVSQSIYNYWEQGVRNMPDEYTERVLQIAKQVGFELSAVQPAIQKTAPQKKIRSGARKPVSATTATELKSIRNALALGQREFADKIGISMTVYKLWEQGKRLMPDEYTANVKLLAKQVDPAKLAIQKAEQQSRRHSFARKPVSTITAAELMSIRQSKKLTQNEFADKIGISMSVYKLWEQGKRLMPDEYTENVMKIANGTIPTKIEIRKRPAQKKTLPIPQNLSPHQSPLTASDLRTIREAARLSQNQFSKILDVPRTTYLSWEQGKSHMPDRYTEQLREIAAKNNIVTLTDIKAEFKKCRETFNVGTVEMARALEVHPETYAAWESDPQKDIPQKYIDRLRHLTTLPDAVREQFFQRQEKRFSK